MHISRIKLQNWKNFRAAEADFVHRVFLIGANASGKSNLLDALRFLRDLAEKGLRDAVDARGSVSAIRCLAARESPAIAIEVTLSDDDGEAWLYRIEFNQDPKHIPLIRHERVIELKSQKTLIDRPNKADQQDPVLLTQTALEQIVANREFRDIADFFKTISYQHLVPQVVRDPKGFSTIPIQSDPFGRDLLLRIWNTSPKTRDAWLKRIGKILQNAVPQLQDLEIEMDVKNGTPHLVGRYEHWRQHSAKQSEAQFSDGTLRLFGLMWAMFEGSGPILLEEPELSLHPEVVRNLPQMFVKLQEEIAKMRKKKGFPWRQLIISTHSGEMLQDKGIGADEILWIDPSSEGSLLKSPDGIERKMLEDGLTAADVLLPKSAPSGQLLLSFDV